MAKDPQPKWTSNQKGPDCMVNVHGFRPANVPGQRVVAIIEDDQNPLRKVRCAVPHLPYERWIDEAGNVLSVPMKTTRVMLDGRFVDDSNHSVVKEQDLYKAGWLKYDKGARGEPQENWDKRREKVIAERQSYQTKLMLAAEERYNFQEEKKKKSMVEAMTQSMTQFMETAAYTERKGRRIKEPGENA